MIKINKQKLKNNLFINHGKMISNSMTKDKFKNNKKSFNLIQEN